MPLAQIRTIFAPAPARPRLPAAEIARRYPRLRWAILESTFLGYATFYLVRNNLSTVSKELEGRPATTTAWSAASWPSRP